MTFKEKEEFRKRHPSFPIQDLHDHATLTSHQKEAFRHQHLLKSFYKLVDRYDLRRKAFMKISRILHVKDQEARYEDLE